MDPCPPAPRFRRRRPRRGAGAGERRDARVLQLRERRMGATVARGGDMGRAQDLIVLASTSPQRSAILTQLQIPFRVVAPTYEETPGGDPLEHAIGKARSV